MFNRLGTIVLMAGLSSASVAATVAITQSSPGPVAIGDTVSLDLTVSDVVDLFAYQFSLQFDPTVVNGISVIAGPALGTAGTTFFIDGAFDNAGGLLGLTAESVLGSIAGFSGSGVLASISFVATNLGVSPTTLNDVLLLNSSFGSLATNVVSSRIVVGITSVPEPEVSLLLLSALVAMVVTAGSRGRTRRALLGPATTDPGPDSFLRPR